jgi:hypothetical protein
MGGNEQLNDNVKWGEKSGKDAVDPQKLKISFAESADFNAEIARFYPDSYDGLTRLRLDLKYHHYDLANTVKDVELLA